MTQVIQSVSEGVSDEATDRADPVWGELKTIEHKRKRKIEDKSRDKYKCGPAGVTC